MEPRDDTEGRSSGEELSTNGMEVTHSQPTRTVPKHTRMSKRRTKTGCLTCRKRRIKCGEQKPVCEQCIKSQRSCQGYFQRVVFKNPLSIWNSMNSVAAVNSASKTKQGTTQRGKSHHTIVTAQDQTLSVSPLVDEAHNVAVSELPTQQQPVPSSTFGPIMVHQNVSSAISTSPSSLPTTQAASSCSRGGLADQSMSSALAQVSRQALGHTELFNTSCSPHTSDHVLFTGSLSPHEHESSFSHTFPLEHEPAPSSHQTCVSASHTAISQAALHTPPPNILQASYGIQDMSEVLHGRNHRHRQPQTLVLTAKMDHASASDPASHVTEQTVDSQRHRTAHHGSTCSSEGPSTHEQHEPYDISDMEINSDDECEDTSQGGGEVVNKYLQHNDLGALVSMALQRDSIERRLRTYRSVIDACSPNMLTTYHPSIHSSPLTDSTTARIFYHFINVFGPNISSYERRPANPSLIFHNRHVQTPQKHLWSYVMPTLALSNQALLHAILALGSFHIAKLQDGPITASLKHYHISLRRVAKNVGLPMRRKHPATLATTLLLGYYELMSADHQKWSNHLLGSKQLLGEIDFKGMSMCIRQQRERQKAIRNGSLHDRDSGYGHMADMSHIDPFPISSEIDQLDQGLIDVIMGRRHHPDNHQTTKEESETYDEQEAKFTKKDIETYEIQQDLYWWYCKHDAYQSLLSGNRLFMNYDTWDDCPPRGPVGKREACYGTYDHLILLTGRLADFASKDIERKRKVIKANGGRWKPPSGFRPPGPPPSTTPDASAQGRAATQMPNFPGMLPGTNVRPSLPRGFSPDVNEHPELPDHDDSLLETQTTEAEREWQEIRTAFDMLRHRFGPDYQPLGSEYAQAANTPFGTSLQFRTYGIAGIWLGWYWAVIFCQRVHPSMPPAAMMAAGIAAAETALYAREIGRTAAGIVHELADLTEVSTQVGACLNESTMGLFIAAVQYQGSMERMWTVQRLRNITRLTGWQTGLAVANACETTWSKAAEMGRGPPYVRTEAPRVFAPSIAMGARRVDVAFSENTDHSKKLVVSKQDRVHYVLGVLGMEEDFNRLDLDGE